MSTGTPPTAATVDACTVRRSCAHTRLVAQVQLHILPAAASLRRRPTVRPPAAGLADRARVEDWERPWRGGRRKWAFGRSCSLGRSRRAPALPPDLDAVS